LVQEVSDTRTL